jgi:hypothetical protein
MKAIEFQLNTLKLLDVRFGESSFKPKDEFWTDFTPVNGEKTTTFLPNIVRDSPKNREVVTALGIHYADQKRMNDEFDKKMYQLRNQLEK